MFNRRGRSKFGSSLAMSYGSKSPAAQTKATNSGYYSAGKKNTNLATRSALQSVRAQTTYVPGGNSFSINSNRIPADIQSQIIQSNAKVVTKVQPQPKPKKKEQAPKQQTPSAFVKSYTPPAQNKQKSTTPKNIQPRGAANLQPRGASMGSSISNVNTATFGDKGYEDVMISFPAPKPKPKPTTNTGTVRSVGTTVSNNNIQPMAVILQDVADRAEARALENQGLSAAELRNTRGVIENKIVQNVREGRDPAGIEEKDLKAGEELRDQRQRYTMVLTNSIKDKNCHSSIVVVGRY